MKYVKILTVSAVVSCASLASNGAFAGGCVYGGHSMEHQAKQAEPGDPLVAAQAPAQSEVDPKWLALQKRLELNAQSDTSTIVVPN